MSIYQVTWKQRWLLQECRNVFYYETITGEPSVSEWGDIVDEIRADILAEWSVLATDTWAFYAIEARRVDVAGLLSFEYLPTSGILTGGSATDSVPTQISCLVSVKGTTTKPNRARSYLCGMNESHVEDSLIIAARLTAAEDLIDLQSVLNAAGTNELQRVSAQWNTNHTLVTAFNNIAGDASVASQVPATQRRRRIGVGI